jgi:hypothetical protein
MTVSPPTHLTARKKPRQARATATLDAIFEATIQVLVTGGPRRLTTTRVADKDEIGGRYLEDCAVTPINDTPPNPFADGVRSYALDATKAKQLWARSVEMVAAA